MPVPATSACPSLEMLFARYRARGDPGALGELFDATAPGLFRLALSLAPDPASAEDALQETFLAAMRYADSFEEGRPLLPWLSGILRRKVEDARRRAGRTPDPLRVVPPGLAVDPAAEAERREELERVRVALAALPEPYRSVGMLRWRFGLEPAEIAELRGDPPGTVRSLLSRALARLRRDLRSLPGVLLFLGDRPERGLDAVRREVLARAARRTGVGLAAATAALLGGVLVTKKAMAAGAILVAALVAWFALGEGVGRPAAGPGATTAVAPRGPEIAEPRPGPAPGPGAQASRSASEEAAPPLRGRVVDRQGRGIPGARVVSIPDDIQEGLVDPAEAGTEGHRTRVAVAGDDGAFTVPVDGEAPLYTLLAEAPGYARTERADLRPGAAEVVLVLDRAAALAGRVLTEEGEPIAGATVRVYGNSYSSGAAFDLSTTSGEGGAYRLAGVPPHRLNHFNWQRYWVEVRADGFARLCLTGRTSLETDMLPDIVPGEEIRKEFYLSRGVTVTGRVLDLRTRRPVPGATVVAWSIEGWGSRNLTLPTGGQRFGGGHWFPPLGETRSADDGSFTLKHLPARGFHRSSSQDMGGSVGYIVVWKKGWGVGLAGIPLVPTGETAERQILLSPAATVEGRVVDENGTPIEGALVQANEEIVRWPRGGTIWMLLPEIRGFPANWAETDTAGRYRMEGVLLRDGVSATVTVRGMRPRPNWGFWLRFDGEGTTVLAAPGETVTAPDLVLATPRWPKVRFLVVDGEGAPVPGASFQPRRRHATGAFRPFASIRTGPDGRGEMAYDPGEDGDWEIAIDVLAPGYAPAREYATPTLEDPEEIRVVLSRGRTLTGRVLAADGSPAPGAWVSVASGKVAVEDALPEDAFLGARNSDTAFLLYGYGAVEEDGSFVVRDLPEGPYHLAATSYRENPGAEDSNILRTILPRVPTDAEGLLLTLPPDPVPTGSRLECLALDAAEGHSLVRFNAALYGDGGRRLDAVQTAPGRCVFEAVPAGTWDLSVAALDHCPEIVRGVEVRDGAKAPTLSVRLERGATVRGSVRDLAGKTLGMVTLSFRPLPGSSPSAREISLDPDWATGTFQIGGFRPGRYAVEIRSNVYGRPDLLPANGETLSVPEGVPEVRFDITASPVATLEVLVTDPRLPKPSPTGTPPPEEQARFGAACRLAVLSGTGALVAEVRGLERSDFTPALTRTLPAGLYTVRLEMPGGETIEQSVVLAAEEKNRVTLGDR